MSKLRVGALFAACAMLLLVVGSAQAQSSTAADPPAGKDSVNATTFTLADDDLAAASNLAWGDYDNDGRLDLLVNGHTGTPNDGIAFVSKLYHSSRSSFEEDPNVSLPGMILGKVAWGDYDSDSKLDFLLSGRGTPPNAGIGVIYHNEGGRVYPLTKFVDSTAAIVKVSQNAVAWGDYDNDGGSTC